MRAKYQFVFLCDKIEKVRCYRFRVKLHLLKGWMYYFGISRLLIFNIAGQSGVLAQANHAAHAHAQQPQRVGEEQQAYMKTCDSCVIPNTTERVYRVRGLLPCHLFRGQLQLPPMRSLQRCLSSLGLHDTFSACVSLELAGRNVDTSVVCTV
jgi:hypothetical protein